MKLVTVRLNKVYSNKAGNPKALVKVSPSMITTDGYESQVEVSAQNLRDADAEFPYQDAYDRVFINDEFCHDFDVLFDEPAK